MSLNFDYLSCEERLDAAIARLDASLARGKSPVCGPSDENGTALCSDSVVPGLGVRIPAYRSALMSGNGAGFVDSACATVLAHDDTSPDSLIPSRMAAFSTTYVSQHVTISEIRPIATESKNARPIASVNVASISSSVVERPIIHVRKSNLDLTGSKLVKRGLTVSYQACRGRVARVRAGHCCIEYLHFSGRLTGSSEWLDCGSVQVVA